MPFATDVKIFRSTDGGAPVLNGAAGALQSLLYACLVTGYNTLTPSSITRDGDTVTVTYSAAHGYSLHAVLNVSGANETDYNGNHRITEVTTYTVKYVLASGVTPATPATGTISTKCAPAGWERTYSGTNKAAFKSTDAASTGCFLRIDDTNTGVTRRGIMRGYRTMTDIDTGVEPFPITVPVYWYKGNDDGTARLWMLVADSMLFFFGNQDGTYNQLHCFGDIISFKPSDAYHCMLTGSNSTSDNGDSYADTLTMKALWMTEIDGFRQTMCRSYGGAENSAVRVSTKGMGLKVWYGNADWHIGGPIGVEGFTYPHPPDLGIIYGKVYLSEYTGSNQTGVLRGIIPGLYDPWHDMRATIALSNLGLNDNIPVEGRKALLWRARAGRIMTTLNNYWSTVNDPTGCVALDVTGPWR
jgi:hypothetical protein